MDLWCRHNTVPIKHFFRNKWMCVRCNEVWLIDPAAQQAGQEMREVMYGSYTIEEEP